jgi:hypothetical protein
LPWQKNVLFENDCLALENTFSTIIDKFNCQLKDTNPIKTAGDLEGPKM